MFRKSSSWSLITEDGVIKIKLRELHEKSLVEIFLQFEPHGNIIVVHQEESLVRVLLLLSSKCNCFIFRTLVEILNIALLHYYTILSE